MECLGNSTVVVRVVSGEEVGYLYFHAGQIVHAMSSSSIGEAAALEILGWNRGSFEPCSAGWPSDFTITRPWQGLIIAAATTRDEARRKVVDFPRDRAQGSTMTPRPPKPVTSSSHPPTIREPMSGTPVSTSSQSGMSPATRGIERAVRLETDGRVLSTRGDADELAAMTAYAIRVSALIGDELGMGDLRAVESISNGTRRLFYTETDGKLIGVEARAEAELGQLREKLGL
jgi:predicted regulator of Ras-like GTPase activity (Roadblock/LC7/MglB family)